MAIGINDTTIEIDVENNWIKIDGIIIELNDAHGRTLEIDHVDSEDCYVAFETPDGTKTLRFFQEDN